MEATKKVTGKSVKKWLGNNAIIVLMLAVSLIVGIIHPNFFALANIINLFKNVSIRYIIALGISGCLITTGNDLSAGRLAGFAACLACIFAQTEGASGKFYPNMPTLSTPVVFILDEPTRGIDVGAKYEIYCIIADLAKQGKSIIMISSEMSEIIGMSNRVMVMCDGRITGFINGKDATQENIMALATQFETAPDAAAANQ